MATGSTRPWLLPQNRKVRHLHGIYLRNLSFSRPRGRSVDDTAVSTKTLAKLEMLRETAEIANSSSQSLDALASPTPPTPIAAATPTATANRQPQPQLHHALSSGNLRPGAVRRRSTNLGNFSPVTRQKKLEAAYDSRAASACFSLHVDGVQDPIYLSEVAERATNFNFRFFELCDLDPAAERSPSLTVKIWVERSRAWTLLIEDKVDLRALHWLGDLEHVLFPPNCLVFHLLDGIYCFEVSGKALPPKKLSATLPTSSYNALIKLATLDASIQDALAMRDSLAHQINAMLGETVDNLPVVPAENALSAARDELELAKKFLGQQRRAAEAARRRKEELQASIAARRKAIAEGRLQQEKAAADIQNAVEKLAESRKLAQITGERIRGQRRRICEDLNTVFKILPVSPSPNLVVGAPPSPSPLLPPLPPLSFQICGTHLPNTTYDSTRSSRAAGEDALSAALGHAALLVHHLQYYLGIPLPYPVRWFGSRSSIRDDISQLHLGSSSASSSFSLPSRSPASSSSFIKAKLISAKQDPELPPDSYLREFPLFVPRGGSSAQFRFDYAWFLLNKDIEALCTSQGLRVVDIRHTLPNLKYLLYVASAGTEDMPERKAGGVRGLWHARLRSLGVTGGELDADGASSIGSGRRGSIDSEVTSLVGGVSRAEALRRAALGGAPDGVGEVRKVDEDEGGHERTMTGDDGIAPAVGGNTEPMLGHEGARALEPLGTVAMPFDDQATKLTLRTKGMRENAWRG